MNPTATEVVEVPFAVPTVTSTVPATSPGEVAVQLVLRGTAHLQGRGNTKVDHGDSGDGGEPGTGDRDRRATRDRARAGRDRRDRGNRAGLAVHLDWRGSNGYILAAPSIHPNGGLYEWVIGPDEAPLKPASASLSELLTKPASSVLTIAQRLERPSDAYGCAALEREVGRVFMAPVGVRNDALNRAAHSLGQLVGGGSLDLPTVIPALERAGLGAELEYQEVRATIKSGLGAGMLSPRRVPR